MKEWGENVLTGEKAPGAFSIFAGQFKDLLTLILLAAAAVSLFLGEAVDAFTIFLIVFLNAILGFSQEFRTEKTLETLSALSAPKATVLRDGKQREIPSAAVVPGDLVFLSPGNKVPADGVLAKAVGLSADESLLTGESVPVEKAPGHPVFMGTAVTAGHGTFTVTKTGMRTEMGKIAGLLGGKKPEPTPLQKKLAGLSRVIAVGCLLICFSVTALGIFRGEPIFTMFLTGLSLSVAAIPEGLTAVITISLGLAVSRMLRRNALVRRLHSVETLGCANIICSDKTGTLTKNRMTVTEIRPANGAVLTEKEFKKVPPLLFAAAALCNNAAATESAVSGEPTETALLRVSFAHGGRSVLEKSRRLAEIPFDSKRKRMSVSVRFADGRTLCFIKGAPDVVLPLCRKTEIDGAVLDLSETKRAAYKSALSAMTKNALRVLAFGYKEQTTAEISEENFIFLGFFGLMDPPRKGARTSVLKAKQAGIKTVMITGDHPETALAIAEKLGIAGENERVYTGAELDRMGPKDFDFAAGHGRVFARVTPEHKLLLVRSLKKSGAIVAMTGDGVNDAPAVKEADIGVSMGKNGTDVTREASGIVLLDDDFSTLVAAVEEGRIIYENIRKFIRYLLSCNIGEVVTMFVGMVLGFPTVLLPIQILMVNLVTDGIPAIALSFDPPQDDVMKNPPRGRNESVFSHGLGTKIVFRGILLGLSVLTAFSVVQRFSGNLLSARTAAFVTLVMAQLLHVFECKSETRSLFTIRFLNNKKLLLAVASSALATLLTVFWPPLAAVFQTVPLSCKEWLVVAAATGTVPLLFAVFHFLRKGK